MASSPAPSDPPSGGASCPHRPPLLRIAIAGAIVSALSFLGDNAVIAWVAAHPNAQVHHIAQLFTKWGDFLPIAALLLALILVSWLIKLPGHQPAVRVLCLMLGSAIVSGILVNILRVLSGRARPSTAGLPGWYGMRLHGHWIAGAFAYSSFPSAHTAVAIAAIVPLWLLLRGPSRILLALPATLLALGIAASRILLNAHHLSDVVTSSCLSILIATALCARFGRRKPSFPLQS
jgi:membrane-associated phospholipid phosphatase